MDSITIQRKFYYYVPEIISKTDFIQCCVYLEAAIPKALKLYPKYIPYIPENKTVDEQLAGSYAYSVLYQNDDFQEELNLVGEGDWFPPQYWENIKEFLRHIIKEDILNQYCNIPEMYFG